MTNSKLAPSFAPMNIPSQTSAGGQVVLPLLTAIAVVAIWELICRAGLVNPLLVPAPAAIATTAWESRAALLAATGRTAAAAAIGLSLSFVLGLLIAALFAQARVVRTSFYPYAIFLQTVPIVAVAPILISWFGYGFHSVVLVAAIISLFPIITAATAGMLQIDPDLVDLMRLNQASRWQRLFKLQLPHAIPAIVTGLKTATGLAVVGAIVGEYFAGYTPGKFGLGYYIFTANGQLKTALLFATVLSSAALGILGFSLVNLLAATVLRRWCFLDQNVRR